MYFRSLHLPVILVGFALGIGATRAQADEWLRRAPDQSLRGVIMMVHGLNVRPAAMLPLAEVFRAQGYDVLNVALHGHRGIPGEMKNVTRDQWLDDFSQSYLSARARAERAKVPLDLVAYSLGAMMGEDSLNLPLLEPMRFNRVVLLAPPLVVRTLAHLVSIGFIFGPGFSIPSANLEPYRAERSTTMAAYRALFDSVKATARSGMKHSDVPTLVYVDPRDELVNVHQLVELPAAYGLSQWQIRLVNAAPDAQDRRTIHHLIIDEASVGAQAWVQMTKGMIEHLNHE